MSNIVMNVQGMSCGHCVNSVEGALKKLDGVKDAKVSLDDNNVSVEYDPGKVNTDQMKEAIEEQGYDVA